MKMVDVAIIGAGPAGIAAGIQVKRYGLDFVLVECSVVGGLLHNANLVENYPGFPQGISGPALVQRMLEHMQSAGVQAVQAEVTSLAFQEGAFHLDTSAGEMQAQILIIASGTRPRPFTDLEIPQNLRSQVFYEVHSLTQLAGKRIAIVGAGDAAFDYALNLARRNQVAILNRSQRTHCLPLLEERAAQSPHITYHASTRLLHLEPRPGGGMLLNCITPAGSVQFEAEFLIGALGRDPQCDFITPEFKSTANALESQGLLYWIGDVQNGRYRQTTIAVGDGVRAAMQIYQRLKEVSS